MTKISIFIITFNEERIIAQCLEKLTWADEIIVVDSGSSDNTVAICQKHGVKVIYNKFENFGKQKQFALEQTTNDWVMNLDADEILSDELITEISNLDYKANGYKIPFKHVFMDKIFNYGNESNRFILRFFNKKYGKYNELDVHEFVEVDGLTENLKNNLLHYSYTSINQYIEKLNKYTTFYAKINAEKGKKFSFVQIIFKTKFEFFKKYFLEKNFLNGKEGFYWAVFSSFYTFSKCVKTNQYNHEISKTSL